ncbi:hypothetical protein EOI86_07080 [Hwanghaeella grinnelliae]|uniref:Uncharacterized protein n=1 Tax=Hwanghaeella grinnelliae TaxID=2500179 RepID=A0A437QX52_9PROT|nr:hypothetical protein [Hwanghaeella grinnelliae]RVU39013.1 hypothetical protein EOI86_07080 [Hwanghaeella grinnelliae]
MTDVLEADCTDTVAGHSWRVVFCDPEPLDPACASWRERAFNAVLKILAPGFRHCFLMRALRTGRGDTAGWLIVNPNAARLDIFEVSDGDGGDRGYGTYIDRLARSGAVHVLDLPQRYPAAVTLRPWFSCVEVVKHTTGVKPPFWVVTPRQLYRWIRANGPDV